MGFWVGFNSRNPSKSLKSGGFIQENAKKRDFLHTWGFIQEWRCIEADTVVNLAFIFQAIFRETTYTIGR